MASAPIPAPVSDAGPGPGGGFASSSPAVEDQDGAALLKLSLGIVAAARMIGQKVPQVSSEVRQINDLVQQIQAKIVGNKAPAEAQAPPV